MGLLGTSRTMTTGVSPGVTPSASLVRTGVGVKLMIGLGSDRLEINLGVDPHAAIVAIRDDLDTIISQSKEAA